MITSPVLIAFALLPDKIAASTTPKDTELSLPLINILVLLPLALLLLPFIKDLLTLDSILLPAPNILFSLIDISFCTSFTFNLVEHVPVNGLYEYP